MAGPAKAGHYVAGRLKPDTTDYAAATAPAFDQSNS